MTEPTWTKGRIVGVLLVLAVPVVAVLMLGGLTGKKKERPAPRPWEQPFSGLRHSPAPLPTTRDGEGLTFAIGDRIDVRPFRRLALHVPEGRPAADFLPKGPFTATFRGTLRIPSRDRYKFTFLGTGKLKLTVGDAVVLESDGASPVTGKRLRLRKGEQPFVATYTSPPTGAATLRVYWQNRDFAREPIPPAALSHGSSDALAAYTQLRRGRELVQELRCAACHERAVVGRGGPTLANAGERLQRDWMAAWIANPAHLRSDASMPDLLHGDDADRVAADIATWLATLGTPAGPLETNADEQRTGAEFFADYGCIACHTLPGHTDAATVHGRVSLANVRAKWQPQALVAFLLEPTAHYPDIRMPKFKFAPAEAKAVAAFLLSREGKTVPAVTAGDAAAGKAAAAKLGCATCHGMPVANTLAARPVPLALDGSYAACSAAKYTLSKPDEEALAAYLTRQPRAHFTAAETATRVLRQQRCGHCHTSDLGPGLYPSVRDEVLAVVPEDPTAAGVPILPDLVPTGGKLRTDWLTGWLGGAMEPRPRPWLTLPMPKFALDAGKVATGLAHHHGYPSSGGEPSVLNGMVVTAANGTAEDHGEGLPAGADLQAIGKRLLPQDGGFGCTTCHNVGAVQADSVFEAPGVDLSLARLRLRKEYFHRWMFNPTRVDPTTKMTRFLDEDGRSGLTDVLSGTGWAQVEAIWRCLPTQKAR